MTPLALLISSILAISPDAGTPGELFYYGFGARTFALGKAFTAADGGVESIYFNPAAVYSVQRGNMAFSYNSPNWMHSYGGFSYIYPTGPVSGFGFNLVFLRTKGARGRDEFARKTKSFRYLEFGGLLSYARRFKEKLSLGWTGKFYYQRLARYVGVGIGLDVGVFSKINRQWNVGATILNLIPPTVTVINQKEVFPMVLRFGAQYRPFPQVRVLSDIVKPMGRSFQFHFGVEVTPVRFFALRFGYDPLDLSTGIGIVSKKKGLDFILDYTLSNYRASGVLYPFSHRLTLTIKFGGYRVWVNADPDKVSLLVGAGGVLTYIYPHVRTKADPEHWTIKIYMETGELAREIRGDGPPPLRLAWDGRDETGRLVPRGRYFYTIEVWDVEQNYYFETGYLLQVVETSIF